MHKWNVENDQACNKFPTSFQLVRLAAFTCTGASDFRRNFQNGLL